jgi:hypothetical protein
MARKLTNSAVPTVGQPRISMPTLRDNASYEVQPPHSLHAHASLLPVQDDQIAPLTATRIDQKIAGCSESFISGIGGFHGDPLGVACQHPILVIRVSRPNR